MIQLSFLKITKVTKESHPNFGEYEYHAMVEGRNDIAVHQYAAAVPDMESIAKFIVEAGEYVGA